MKNKHLLFIIGLLFFSCGQKKKEVLQLNCILTSDTLCFHLNMPQYNGKMAGRFYDKKTNQEYIYFGNDFNGLEVFNTKAKPLFHLPIKESLPNIPSIQSVQFISIDSVLIFSAELNLVFLLNQKGKILKIIELPKKIFKHCETEYAPTMGNLFYHREAIYTNMFALVNDFDEENELVYRRRQTNINIQLPYCQKINGVFSDSTYWGKHFPFKWSRFIPKNTNCITFSKFFISGDKLLVTSIHTDSLFVFRLNDFKLLKSQKISSKYNKKIGVETPVIDSIFIKSSYDAREHFFRTSAYITNVIYNPSTKLYHLLVINETKDRSLDCSRSIITLDEDLNKVNERKFYCEKYGDILLFSGNIWLRYYTKNEHEVLDKQKVTFIRLNYEKK